MRGDKAGSSLGRAAVVARALLVGAGAVFASAG